METTDRRPGDVSHFTEIDLTPDARFFVDFMDIANAAPGRRRLKSILAERLDLYPGARVLDVGCGTGDDARILASLVEPGGGVIGIDASETMIGVARERSRAGSLPVEFAIGDAFALDFADNAFDACRCDTVLMHLDGDPARAIAEMVRVTRVGGRVALSDFHWDALVIDHPDRTRTREIVYAACDAIRHGWIGSQLPRLAADAGMIDIQVEGHAMRSTHQVLRQVLTGPLVRSRLSEIDVAQWWQPLDEAEARGQFMATMLTFIVTGTVPA